MAVAIDSDDATINGVNLTQQGTDLATPASGHGILYYKGDLVYLRQDDGTILEIGPSSASPGGSVASLLLDYATSSDLHNGTTFTAGTWGDVITNQSFTVDDATAVVAISVRGSVKFGNAGATTWTALRIVIDSAGTPINKQISFVQTPSNNNYNALSGTNTVFVTGLSAAAHTLKLQAYPSTNNADCYLRTTAVPQQEWVDIQVVQL